MILVYVNGSFYKLGLGSSDDSMFFLSGFKNHCSEALRD
ncbi:hypothetical protein AM1_G0170 (plasmid) [Acaryochloris marina MBIC11017]|uniref:Uncharacterized protein n=1 Tax=Acaryochloris marina (strain MBIC 11017) TaxID=329726 RepID=A8ZQR4_ACAM1|nr:hypothetical protein AM1_G0170 [Acaryochloris marina MBIC11017]